MSNTLPSAEQPCDALPSSCAAVELILQSREKDLGGFPVRWLGTLSTGHAFRGTLAAAVATVHVPPQNSGRPSTSNPDGSAAVVSVSHAARSSSTTPAPRSRVSM